MSWFFPDNAPFKTRVLVTVDVYMSPEMSDDLEIVTVGERHLDDRGEAYWTIDYYNRYLEWFVVRSWHHIPEQNER